jgi:Pyruvate-formate lyase
MLLKRGRTLEDARDYCIIGCVEPSGSGNEWSASGGPGSEVFFNLLGPIIMAIHNGTNPLTDFSKGLKTGYLYDYKTFDEFKDAFSCPVKILSRLADNRGKLF